MARRGPGLLLLQDLLCGVRIQLVTLLPSHVALAPLGATEAFDGLQATTSPLEQACHSPKTCLLGLGEGSSWVCTGAISCLHAGLADTCFYHQHAHQDGLCAGLLAVKGAEGAIVTLQAPQHDRHA